MRQLFHQLFRFAGRLGNSIAHGRIFSRNARFPPAQWICKLRNKFRSCAGNLSARGWFFLPWEQKNHWKYRTAAGFSPPPVAGPKITWKSRFSADYRKLWAAFRPCRWKSESSAGNSKVPLEIRRSPGSFLLVREVSDLQLNFWISSQKSESSAEVLIFRSMFGFSGRRLRFPPAISFFFRPLRFSSGTFFSCAELFIPPLSFWIFRKRLRRSAENLNGRGKIQFFAGNVRPLAGDLNFPWTSQISSDRFSFSAELSIVPLRFRISGGTPNVRLTIWIFRPQFSIFPNCFESSAELLKLRRHF